MGQDPAELYSLFHPKTLAIIGASQNQNKVGGQVVRNILMGGYQGKIFPINPKSEEILKIQSYPSVKTVPDPIDLALITIPNTKVPAALEECIENDVKFAIIITAGFKEIGSLNKEGITLNEEILRIIRKGNTRVIGPNCMGVASSESRLLAMMGWTALSPRSEGDRMRVSIVSQSGTWGVITMRSVSIHGVGFSKLVSSGNEADLKLEDYVEYFGLHDDDTDIILCFVEGLRKGKKFTKIAAEIKKPIIVLKGGRTLAGSKAANSHTGSIAGSRQIYDSIFKQCGVIQADNSTDLVDLARALSTFISRKILPKGRKVAIYTGGGGAGVLTADFCAMAGLELAKLSKETITKLNQLLPPYWPQSNPVDLVATINFSSFTKVLKILADAPEVDIIISNLPIGISWHYKHPDIEKMLERLPQSQPDFVKMIEGFEQSVASTIRRIARHANKPIVCPTGLYSADLPFEPELISKFHNSGALIVNSSWDAARIMAKVVEYSEYLKISGK